MTFAKRHLLAILSFLGFVNLYMMRSNMGVALVAMVKPDIKNLTNVTALSPDQFGEGCHHWSPNVKTNASANEGEYTWDSVTKGAILGAFFFGYIFSQIPGGYLATVYGPVIVLTIGVAGSGVLTLLTPLAAKLHVYVLILNRVLLGVFQGVYIPATHVVWARWAPPYERTKLVALSFSGVHIGIVLAHFGSGAIANYLHWQWIFYICGILSLLWTVAWFFLAYDSPTDPKAGVSVKELHKILELPLPKDEGFDSECNAEVCEEPVESESDLSRHTTVSSAISANSKTAIVDQHFKTKAAAAAAARSAVAPRPKTPWLKMATSPAVWAIVSAHFAHTWFFYTLMTQMAIFLHDELHLSHFKNGLLSALPFASFFIGQTTSSYLCDWLRANSRFSTTVIRKSFYGIGAIFASGFILVLTFVGCNIALIAPVVCISTIAEGFTICGFFMNHIDIAPQFAGILMGFTNGLAAIPGFVSPLISGTLTADSDVSPPSEVAREWRNVFGIAAGVHLAGAVVFTLLGSGKRQPWAVENHQPDGNDSNNNNGNESEATRSTDVATQDSHSEDSCRLNETDVQALPNSSTDDSKAK